MRPTHALMRATTWRRCTECGIDHIDKCAAHHRLAQQHRGREFSLACDRHYVVTACGNNDNRAWRVHQAKPVNALHARKCVDARHLPVDKHQVVMPFLICRRQRRQHGTGISNRVANMAQLPHHTCQDIARPGACMGQQYAYTLRAPARWRLCRQIRWCSTQAHVEVKGAATTGRALHPYPAAHHFGQLARDGQPEAGPAILPRGRRIRLAERLEKAAELFLFDPDTGIAHRKLQTHLFAGTRLQRHHDAHLATRCELHRVVAEIDQYLSQAQWVAEHAYRHIVGNVEHEFQALVRRFRSHRVGNVGQYVIEAQPGLLDIQLAGLDL